MNSTMLTLHVLIGLTFSTAALCCVLLSLVGIPGVWILIGLAIGINIGQDMWLDANAPHTFHWITIVACVVIAIGAEVTETLLGGIGAKRFGASKQGVIGAIAGSIAGAIAGTIFLPIPFLGTLIGAATGAALGAMLGELIAGKQIHHSWKPALGAALGRILGSLAKLPFIVAVAVILSVAAFVP